MEEALQLKKRLDGSESVFQREIKWIEILRVSAEVLSTGSYAIYLYFKAEGEGTFIFIIIEVLYLMIVLIQNVHTSDE